jgi:hypothetical protein
MKLCKDCMHLSQTGSDAPLCLATPKIDYVFGMKSYYHCSVERAGHMKDDCGPEGKRFVPKKDAQ